MVISVIVCTYNRSELLRECLLSLKNQTAAPDLYEVIVVNNNSTDDTIDVFEEFSSLQPLFRLVFEPQMGLSHARNRGYLSAQTEWVIYIDDDAKAYPNWIVRAIYTINKYGYECFGGVVESYFSMTRPQWIAPDFNSNIKIVSQFKEVTCVNNIEPWGGNLCIKKSALEKMDGFNPHFGVKGKLLGYAEETDLILRMRSAGYRIAYDPELWILHLVAPQKLLIKWHFKSAFVAGRDGVPIWSSKIQANCWALARYILKERLFIYTKSIIRSLVFLFIKPHFYLQNAFIDAVAPILYDCGIVYRLFWTPIKMNATSD